MGFVISSLKTLFGLLNVIAILIAAVYLGFGAFMLISRQEFAGFGLNNIGLTLLVTGGIIIFLSMIGFCSVTGRRSYLMQFFSGCLLLSAIFQVGFGVLVIIHRSKTDEYMDTAWNNLSSSLKSTFENAHNCCGFKSTTDRTNCTDSRSYTAIACSLVMTGKQSNLLTWLAIALFSAAMVSFINYLISYSLVRQYAKAHQDFKHRQLDVKDRKKKKDGDDGASVITTRKYDSDLNKKYELTHGSKPDEESIKSVSLNNDSSTFDNFKNYFKISRKPDNKNLSPKENIPKSTGSMMTYEQIAAKYRK